MKLTYDEVDSIRFILGDLDRKIKEMDGVIKRTASNATSHFLSLPYLCEQMAGLVHRREGMVDILLRLDLMREIRRQDSPLEQIARTAT